MEGGRKPFGLELRAERPESSIFNAFWMPVADPVISGDQVRHDDFETFARLSIVDSYKNSQCSEYNNIRRNTMGSISEESKLVIASNLTVAAILRDILILQTGEKPLKDPDEFIVDKFKSISGLLFSEDSNE